MPFQRDTRKLKHICDECKAELHSTQLYNTSGFEEKKRRLCRKCFCKWIGIEYNPKDKWY